MQYVGMKVDLLRAFVRLNVGPCQAMPRYRYGHDIMWMLMICL